MTQIPKRYKDKLPRYAEKTGKTVKVLEEILTEQFSMMKELKPELTDSKAWRPAYSRFIGILRREDRSIFSPAPMWSGFVWGAGDLLDFIDLSKKKALSRFNNPKTKTQAILDNLIDASGTPLDTREKINYGKDENPNYGRPYPDDEHSWYRAIYGIVSKGAELTTDVQFFKLNVNGEEARNIVLPPKGVMIHFRANPRRRASYGFLDLNAISGVEISFQDAKQPEEIPDIQEALMISAWNPITIKDMETVYQLHEKDRTVPVLLEANVATIGTDTNSRTGNRTLWLDDEDIAFERSGATCFINGNIPIEFGLDSRIIFVGRIEKLGIGDDEDVRYIFSADGYYALPDFLIPPTSI